MARSIEEIFDQMITEKETKATLSGLLPEGSGNTFQDLLNEISSLSKVANWRLWIFIHAFGTFALETIFDQFVIDVNIIKLKSVFGTDAFWIDQMFLFQLGDPVITVNIDGVDVPAFEVIDESKQIIAAAAISSAAGVATIKVAKDDGFGNLIALNTTELISVNAFVQRIQPAGLRILAISLSADLIKTFADIHFDALFDESVITTNVEAAIDGYFTSLEFGSGIMNINSLIDAVQLVEGVNDIKITDIEAKPNGGTFTVIDREYLTSAGYLNIDPAFPLSATLTFISE